MESEEQVASSEYLEETSEVDGVALAAQPYQAGAPAQSDLAGMSADDMRSYSESVAQAADVVNNESEVDNKKDLDGMSLVDLKRASIASAKAEKELSGTKNKKKVEKAAIHED